MEDCSSGVDPSGAATGATVSCHSLTVTLHCDSPGATAGGTGSRRDGVLTHLLSHPRSVTLLTHVSVAVGAAAAALTTRPIILHR